VQPLLGVASIARGSALSRKERVDSALEGRDVDRPPFSFWHHFGLKTAEDRARATLDFHRQYRTDFVKVTSDFAYPRPAGKMVRVERGAQSVSRGKSARSS